MTTATTIKLVLFFAVLAIGIAFGVARDLYSFERSVVKGVVVDYNPGGTSPKSPGLTPASIKARLADGAIVTVATKEVTGPAAGSEIDITELVTPWGQIWYKQRR
jgi:hypothetical protein